VTAARIVSLLGVLAGTARGDTLVALAPADDARKAIAIGPSGEVYEPAAGAWVRTKRFATASTLTHAGRASGDVVAAGGGVVYKLAPNGWSALRLAQNGIAVMSPGPRAVGAVGRQLYALDRLKGGEPEKLAQAPGAILAIGSGKTIVVATGTAVHRVTGGTVTKIGGAPGNVRRFVDDRWALLDSGAFDLRSGKATPWPAGATVGAATILDDKLFAVAKLAGGVELFTVAAGKLERAPIAGANGAAAGIVVDRAGRAVVALADGQLFVRDGKDASWTATRVRDELPEPRPGPAPATSR
jgi:hypothetical protein